MFLPFGVVDAPASRFPWVSLSIGVLCAIVFLLEPDTQGSATDARRAVREFRQFCADHPAVVPTRAEARLLDRANVEEGRVARDELRAESHLPPADTLAADEREMHQLFSAVLDAAGDQVSRKWGLVPVRGWGQRGWITHMFLHGGFMHLAGNMLFFAVVGPSIEALLGPWVFLLFYLLSGLISGGAQLMMTHDSPAAIVGASGAIASCMGAFSLRFFRSRVKVLVTLFLLLRKVFLVPAWLWGGFWIGGELLSLREGGAGSGGVAVMAHVGGFFFGMAAVAVLRVTGIEKHLTTPLADDEKLWRQDTELAKADEALASGDASQAVERYQAVLSRRPNSVAAMWGLAQSWLQRGNSVDGTRFFERALMQWTAEGNDGAVTRAVQTHGGAIDPQQLRPAFAARLAPMLERENPTQAEALYEVAGQGGVAKAFVRLVELKAARGEGDAARELAARLRAQPDLPADLKLRLNDAVGAAEAAPTSSKANRLVCRLTGYTTAGLAIETLAGEQFPLLFSDIGSVAVGFVASFTSLEGARKNVMVTDLVLRRPRRNVQVLRIPSHLLGLKALFPPEVSMRSAYQSLLGDLLGRSQAAVWPGWQELSAGNYPKFADLAAFEDASSVQPAVRAVG
jgi:membrane associated rhomboid family serine protease